MIKVRHSDKEIVELDLIGKITAADYQKITPSLEKIFREDGKQKFIFNFEKVENYTVNAFFADCKFDLTHMKFIGTTAVVSSSKDWAKPLTKIANAFYPPAKIEYFPSLDEANQWLSHQSA